MPNGKLSPTPNSEDDLTVFQCNLDRSKKCEHEWEHGDGRNGDHCTKCGQNFLAYIYMECP